MTRQKKSDGYRVLVDRLWPRGIKKTDLAFNEWNKTLTPSSELRKAFHAELIDFSHFSEQYRAELAQQQQEGKRLAEIAQQQTLTLLYAAKIPSKTTHWCSLSGYVNADRVLLGRCRMISTPE